MKNSYLKYLEMIKGVRETNVCEINHLQKENGEFHLIFPNICAYEDKFREYMRMSKETFHCLEFRIKHRLDKSSTNFIRTPITIAKQQSHGMTQQGKRENYWLFVLGCITVHLSL